ncbi:alpha/beta fold hydrolase [Nesterenkonia marinintestina]|uniref:alpha/beta fold hydrolase n=1 Tax=Nesterenkonia marinintestina TaxID=2979865 RepID=UPI0021BE4D77|nr:alpha/beta fold hydrolase [Nesterenkonia sp. GX14115]
MTDDHQPTAALRLTPQLLHGDEAQLNDPPERILVVGPSLGTSVTALWQPTLELMTSETPVIGWDLPGHGIQPASDGPFSLEELADAVETMVDELAGTHGWARETVVDVAGVSVAGVVSLLLALRPNTRFRRVAVLCSAASIGTADAWHERADLVETAGTPTMVAGSAERWFGPCFMSSHAEIATNLLSSLQYADRHSYAHVCRALAEVDLRDRLGEATRPVLAVAGEEDVVCPPADAELIAAGVPDGRSETLAGVAHLAPAEAPAAVARLLEENLDD